MSDLSDADFASYVDRIMACRDAEDAAKADTKLVYAAAADAGLDKTALGMFVRVERMDNSQVSKANRKDALADEYRARYRRGKASHVRVREAAVQSTTQNTSVPAGFDPETGEEVTTQIQPETANETQPAPAVQDGGQELSVSSATVIAIESEDSASDAGQAPSNITTLRQPKPFRPNCLNRDKCGGQGPVECWQCTKAAAANRGATA